MRYLHAGENSSNLSVNLSVLLPDQKAAPFMSSGRLGVHQSGLVWNQAPVGLDGNTMNQVDYLQHGTESLPFQNKLEIKCFSDYQIKDVDINQTSDVQKVLVIKEEIPLKWISSLDQQDSESLNIKEEREDVWTNQEGEFTRLPSISHVVKSEDDEEKPQLSQVHQRHSEDDSEAEPPTCSLAKQLKTETDGGDCGRHLQANSHSKHSDSSETEVSDDDDWQGPPSDSAGEIKAGGNGWKESAVPESDINSHMGCDTAKKIFYCWECDKQYLYKQSLHRHMKCHSSNLTKTKCFSEQENLNSQTRVDTEEKTFICDVCGQRFNQRTNLRTHRRVHTGEKPFSCDECGKRFNQQGNLQSHKRVHTGEKPFICDYCGERFRHHGSLQAHVRVHTGEKPFVCSVCGKKFGRKVHFETHMRVHTGERPFGCGICGKEFSHKTHFKEHIRVHTGEKPFTCEACGKRFRLQCNLKRHMRVHTGEKPFGCDECGRTFSCKSHLKRHTKVHTGERPFTCDICGEKFTEPSILKSHIRVHTGEKPFRCDVCGKTFSQQCTLKRHRVVHTGEKPFSCTLCGVRFTQQGNLKSHMRIHR